MIVAKVGAEIGTVEYTESCGKYTLPQNLVAFFCYEFIFIVSGSRKRDLMTQRKKNELSVSYTSPPLSAKILGGKPSKQRTGS